MVNPDEVTQYDRTDWELQEFLLFAIAVAGKTAKRVAPTVDRFLTEITNDGEFMPFDAIRGCAVWGVDIGDMLRGHGLGCHTDKAKAFIGVANRWMDLRTCSLKQLEDCFGIGPKTSRFFVMHSRRDAEPMAALDTHILKFLEEEGVERVPKSTPTGKNYARLEQEFLDRVPCDMSPADFDLIVWKRYRK